MTPDCSSAQVLVKVRSNLMGLGIGLKPILFYDRHTLLGFLNKRLCRIHRRLPIFNPLDTPNRTYFVSLPNRSILPGNLNAASNTHQRTIVTFSKTTTSPLKNQLTPYDQLPISIFHATILN